MSDATWEKLSPSQQEQWLKESQELLTKQVAEKLPTLEKMAEIAKGATSESDVVDKLATALTDAIMRELGE